MQFHKLLSFGFTDSQSLTLIGLNARIPSFRCYTFCCYTELLKLAGEVRVARKKKNHTTVSKYWNILTSAHTSSGSQSTFAHSRFLRLCVRSSFRIGYHWGADETSCSCFQDTSSVTVQSYQRMAFVALIFFYKIFFFFTHQYLVTSPFLFPFHLFGFFFSFPLFLFFFYFFEAKQEYFSDGLHCCESQSLP